MTKTSEFLQSVRDGNWTEASALVHSGDVDSSIPSPSHSVLTWLIELDAPTTLIVDLLNLLVRKESIDPNSMGLLDTCLDFAMNRANAFSTFVALLDYGLSPNVIISGGCTLFQKAIELNRVHEVEALLKHGVDPDQMSVFGRESTSNLDEATSAENAAGRIAIETWQRNNAVRRIP